MTADKLPSVDVSRRKFIQLAGSGAGALVIGLYIPFALQDDADAAAKSYAPNAWLRVTSDGEYTFILDRAEMGQGVMTALPLLLGEELDFDPRRFKIENAPADRRYDNSDLSMQVTGGSTSVHAAWRPLRKAGAEARMAFVMAAAEAWRVPLAECETENGLVIHKKSNQSVHYHKLLEAAEKIQVGDVVLKTPAQFRYIGKPMGRLENHAKVTGKPVFGIDVTHDNLHVGYIIRKPSLGATPSRFEAKKAMELKGVQGVYQVSNGVAVVAKNYWLAKKAAALVDVEWSTDKSLSATSSESILKAYTDALAANNAQVATDKGDWDAAVKSATKTIEATYEIPYVAHATMEPQNCTAFISTDKCQVWAPTQSPPLARKAAAAASGMSEDQIEIYTTLLGGGFGRRLAQDYVGEAVEVAKACKVPVKVVWSREQDMQHSILRPNSLHSLRATFDASNQPTGWYHHLVSQSILAHITPEWGPAIMPDWVPNFAKNAAGSFSSWLMRGRTIDDTAVEGAKDMPYDIPSIYVEHTYVEPGVAIGFWRSVGHSYTGFVVEGFVDEVAHASGQDPFAFRKSLLKDSPRNLKVLETVADRAGWTNKLEAGRFRGIAQHASFRSFAAAVAEVAVQDNNIAVKRVTVAVDCGTVINPDMVKAQVESAVLFGLTAALHSEITLQNGAVVQSNFHDYPILRMNEAPIIDVHIVASTEAPTGIGEPGVPPIAPAVANAVFAATGKRLRKLPLKLG